MDQKLHPLGAACNFNMQGRYCNNERESVTLHLLRPKCKTCHEELSYEEQDYHAKARTVPGASECFCCPDEQAYLAAWETRIEPANDPVALM